MSVPPPHYASHASPIRDSNGHAGRTAVVATFGGISICVWIWAILGCFDANHRVDRLSDRIFDGPSAVQISQVANQTVVRMICYLSAAAGSTVVFLVVAAIALVSVRRQ